MAKDRSFDVTITEIVKYSKRYTVSELEALLGTSLADMDNDEIMSYIADDPQIEDDLQPEGDVQRADWLVSVAGD